MNAFWKKACRGFTLIELLIVVAIIAILAAIAVPNFLEAQTRSKVAKVKGDMRSIATAIECYMTDYSQYPIGQKDGGNGGWYSPLSRRLQCLTTPIMYISGLPRDQFGITHHGSGASDESKDDTYDYADAVSAPNNPYWLFGRRWRMASAGPDKKQTYGGKPYRPYDPTNGTKSEGDIILVQGGGNGWWEPYKD